MDMKFPALRRCLVCAAVAAALIVPAAADAQVVVLANGSPITELDIQQRTRLIASSTHKTPSRKQVIDELIDDRLKIAKAKSYGLAASDAEVDKAFNNMAQRQGVTKEQFTQFLARAGVSPNAVKARIRAELIWGQMIRGKFSASLHVGDAEILQAMRARDEKTDLSDVGYLYTLYPITIVIPDGSSGALVAEKRREAENLRARFTNCKQGLVIARSLRDVAVRDSITRSSADLPQQTRDLLGKLAIGRLTESEMTSQGLQMFALCNKQQTKTESPLKRQIRQELYSKRFEAESKKFLEEIRSSAMIEYK